MDDQSRAKTNPLILAVDDDADTLRIVEMTLKSRDFNVWSAENGREAYELLLKNDIIPDLIVSDIVMPDMDGFDLFKDLKEHDKWKNVPFLFLSAKDEPADVRLGKMLGADDYITKPFKEDELIKRIKNKLSLE